MNDPSGHYNKQLKSTLSAQEERMLLEAVAEGNLTAYTRLYNVYLPFIHQYIAKFLDFNHPDIQEVTQDVFFKIWKRKEALIAVRSFDKFLFVVARNTLTDFFRSRKANQVRNKSLSDNWTPPKYPAEEKIISSEYYSLAQQALALMPEKRRQIFELRTIQELSLEEIASLLDISVSGVHQNLRKAVEFIKDYFGKHGIDVSTLLIYCLATFR